jgi:hypothetical protein
MRRRRRRLMREKTEEEKGKEVTILSLRWCLKRALRI